LYREYGVEAAVAAEPTFHFVNQSDRAMKGPKNQVTEQFIDDQLMRLDRQVQSWGRIDQEQVDELLRLVKSAGQCVVLLQ